MSYGGEKGFGLACRLRSIDRAAAHGLKQLLDKCKSGAKCGAARRAAKDASVHARRARLSGRMAVCYWALDSCLDWHFGSEASPAPPQIIWSSSGAGASNVPSVARREGRQGVHFVLRGWQQRRAAVCLMEAKKVLD